MNTLFGMKVVVSPLVRPVPKLQLRPDAPCTDAFRAEMNQWLHSMFGEKHVAYVLGDQQKLVISREQERLLRQYCEVNMPWAGMQP